jgi:4-diphosphocytidyl-2-C-methyl-D-erythritol kinase
VTRRARVAAQGKINLFLRVLAREESGYHSLETLFARIDLADEIVVRTGVRGRTLDCTGPAPSPMEENLAYRAACAYALAAGWPDGFAIELDKRIPAGGGLGGGSADAGAVLRALDALAPSPLGVPALLRIAASLGADVPFLTLEHPVALAWGRGERMLALPPLEPRAVDLVVFPFGVATGPAFGWLAAERGRRRSAGGGSGHGSGGSAGAGSVGSIPSPLFTLSQLANWDAVAQLAGNDFEEVVAPRHPAIAEVLARARTELKGDGIAGLSGSGSTVFVLPIGGAAWGGDSLPKGARRVPTRTSGEVVGVTVIE